MIEQLIELPSYTANESPDSKAYGEILDDVLRKHFPAKQVVLRALSLSDHPTQSRAALAATIKRLGTDKYDDRAGQGYDIAGEKALHFFGVPADLAESKPITAELINDFYHSALGDRGRHLRIDMLLVYDAARVSMVEHLYDGHQESDGFTFNDPNQKPQALLGIVHIL